MSMSPSFLPPIALIILIICSSAAVNANNARHNLLRQPNKGADKQTSSSTTPRSLQLLNLKQSNKNKTPRPKKTKQPTTPKHPSPTSSPSIISLSPSIDTLEYLPPLDSDTNTTATDEDIFSASSEDNETHNPNDAVIDDGKLTDVYVVQDSSLEEDVIHRPLTGGKDKPIISSSGVMSKDTVEGNIQTDIGSSSTKTINVGTFDMTFTMYNKDVAQPNKKKLLRLLQSTNVEKEDTLEQIASDLYSIAVREHLESMYESTFPSLLDIPSIDVNFEDQDTTSLSQGTIYHSKFDVDFYANDLPSEEELKQMILIAFTDETNKEQFYQRFHNLYANDSTVQQIESVGEIGGTGAGALLKKLYNVDVQEVGLVAQEDEANTVSATKGEAKPGSSSDSSDSGISTGLLIALTVLSCAIILVIIAGLAVYWKKYHGLSTNENRSGVEEPKYWKPLNDEEGVADDLALVESNDLEQQQEYDMNIMSQMQVEGTPGISNPEYGGANLEDMKDEIASHQSSISSHIPEEQYKQGVLSSYSVNEEQSRNHHLHQEEQGSVVSGWSLSEVADHDTHADEFTDDDGGISVSNTSLVGASELFRTVMRYDDEEGQNQAMPDMAADKLNITAETEIAEVYDEDFLGYVVDNDDDDSESRGAFIKEILSRSEEEEDGGEEENNL